MEVFVNVGSPKACLFIHMSNRLLDRMIEMPLLYDAIEESLISEKNGYYSIGIIVWHDLLKTVLHSGSKEDSEERNIPAHDVLTARPTKESYERLLVKFKEEARKRYLIEVVKETSPEVYQSKLHEKWKIYMKKQGYEVKI